MEWELLVPALYGTPIPRKILQIPPRPPLTSTHQSAHKEQCLLPALKAPGLSGMVNSDCNSSDLWVGSTSGAVGSTGAG